MRITKFEEKSDWELYRKGKITGSRLKDFIVKRGTEMKKGYYELIAERIAIEPDGENPMERGTRLEPEAIDLFVAEMVEEGIPESEWVRDLVIWEREDNNAIALSPDAYHKDLEVAVEVKCLNSADHIKAYLTKEVPAIYDEQVTQYFIVNDNLQKLFFVMYDPRLVVASFFYLQIGRDEKKIADYLKQQHNILASVEAQVAKLTEGLF